MPIRDEIAAARRARRVQGGLAGLLDMLDPGRLRYGVSTAEKEAMAIGRELPGAPADPTEGQERANRYASGYLFARQHPGLARLVMPSVSRLKTSDLPFLGGSSPELQSWADAGATRAIDDTDNERMGRSRSR